MFVTPKFRPMSEDEITKFNLRYYGGKEIVPVLEASDVVWATAVKLDTPTYRVYNCGTNDLRIFKYNPIDDTWTKIELSQVENLYGLVWILSTKIKRKQDEKGTKKV